MNNRLVLQDHGRGNRVDVGEISGGVLTVTLRGDHSTISIPKMRVRRALSIVVNQGGSRLTIGEDCLLEGSIGMSQGGSVIIGRAVSAQQFAISSQEGRLITIGDHCMFGRNVQIRNSDAHPIFDLATRRRINPAADTHIAAHVWGAHNSSFLKGCRVGMNSVVGANSAVLAGDYPEGAILVGAPAKVIRTGIIWDRWFGETLDDPALSDFLSDYIPQDMNGGPSAPDESD